MKKNGVFYRLRVALSCFVLVMIEDLRSIFSRKRELSPQEPSPCVPSPGVGEKPAPCADMRFPEGDWRKEVLDDFASWLKDLDSFPESPPAMDLSHDRFEVVGEITALRQEIKRQSREQGKLNEELNRMGDLYKEALSRLGATTYDLASLKQEVQDETEKSVFFLFADLRDALERGLDGVLKATAQQSFFRKLPPAWNAVREGYELALSRFDRAMANLGIQKIEARGLPFDSKLMVAIATRCEPGVEAGTVLEESLSGYVRGEVILRTARVVVASDPIE